MIILEMKSYNTILIEKLQNSSPSFRKTNIYEYLIGGETLPSSQKQIIETAKFTYSPLGKAFEKQIKTI